MHRSSPPSFHSSIVKIGIGNYLTTASARAPVTKLMHLPGRQLPTCASARAPIANMRICQGANYQHAHLPGRQLPNSCSLKNGNFPDSTGAQLWACFYFILFHHFTHKMYILFVCFFLSCSLLIFWRAIGWQWCVMIPSPGILAHPGLCTGKEIKEDSLLYQWK